MEATLRSSGIALLMVVVVLAALTIIAVPFMASMRLAEKSSKSFLDRKRAEWIARGALNHAKVALYQTHDVNERYNLLGEGDYGTGNQNTPDFDDHVELAISPLQLALPDGSSVSFNDPQGKMWSVEVFDEQGKVNVNSATPWLVANLMGVTELGAKIDVEDTIIPVEDPTIFYSDGDPDSIDGYVRIDGEYIAYRGVSEGALTGCLRGIFLEADKHGRGALVYDGRAFKISEHRVHSSAGRLSLFVTPESIREISNWTKFDAVAEALLYRQLYIDKLKELGVDEEDVEIAGVDPGRLVEPEKPGYTPTQAEVNKKLRDLGMDADRIRGLLGDDIVDRIGPRIPSSMPQNPQRQAAFEQMMQNFNEYVEQIEAEEKAKEDRLKKFLPQAFRNIKVLKELLFLEALSAIDYKRLRDFITTFSWRARDWSYPVRLYADIPVSSNRRPDRRILPVWDRRHFNRGTLVRISQGSACEYVMIAGRDRMGRVITDQDIRGSYLGGEAQVQAVLRHPVNINSCSDRVLKALLVGLSFYPFESDIRYIMRGQQPKKRASDRISLEEADALVELIRENPPTCHEDLNTILDNAEGAGVISELDAVAVRTNAINPNDPSLVVSTTGFCYKSYNIFTIQATGVVNSPAGVELARHSIREVVEIGPPRLLSWVLDSQQDFSPGIVRWFDVNSGRKSVLQFDDREANKIATLPVVINSAWQFPSTSHDPEEGDMRIETGRMADGDKYSEHYDDRFEGEDLTTGISLPTDQNMPIVNERQNYNPRSIRPGHFACWFKPTWSTGVHYFLDHGKSEYESRLTFYYDGAELVLMVSDAGVEEEGQTLRAPFAFMQGIWYHIACSWKGVRYGDLAIYVDGKSKGLYEKFTRLVRDVNPQDTQIMVEDVSALGLPTPDTGKNWYPGIKIDSEAMNVTNIDLASNTLTVESMLEPPPSDPPPAGWTPADIRAAVRGTQPTPHYDGAVVTVWGYWNYLSENLKVGGATTVYDLADITPETNINKPGGGVIGSIVVAATEVTIPVDSTADFPPEGLIIIGMEKIYYGALTPVSFIQCLRGVESTIAADHTQGTTVTLISIKVTDTTDYNDSGTNYIQLDDEWIRYAKAKDPNYTPQYLIIPYTSAGQAGQDPEPRRAQLGTTAVLHAAGAKVIPVFRTRNNWCDGGDIVTVLDGSYKTPTTMWINHASGRYAALTDFVPQQIDSSNWGRLLKWPSGELPSELQPAFAVCGSAVTPGYGIMAMVDEIEISSDTVHSPYATIGFVLYKGIGASDTSLEFGVRPSRSTGGGSPGGQPGNASMGGVPKLQQYGGLIKVDDEIIGVVEVSGSTFGQLKRGLLGTTADVHPEGSRIYISPFPKAGRFDGGLDDTVPCRNPGRIPREGYIQVAKTDGSGEIVPYRLRGNSLWRYRDIYGNPVFRSAFGTTESGFGGSDLGIYIPFRYHDLYEANKESRQGVYYYAANTVNYAYFNSITWDADIPLETVTKVQVRIDGEPDWDAQPSNVKGGLFEFIDPGGDNVIGVMGQVVELRVYLTYAPGAFASDAWKDTPVVRSISLKYYQPCIVHYHETGEE